MLDLIGVVIMWVGLTLAVGITGVVLFLKLRPGLLGWVSILALGLFSAWGLIR